MQSRLGEPEIMGDLGGQGIGLSVDRDHITANFDGCAVGMAEILPARTHPHRLGVNQS